MTRPRTFVAGPISHGERNGAPRGAARRPTKTLGVRRLRLPVGERALPGATAQVVSTAPRNKHHQAASPATASNPTKAATPWYENPLKLGRGVRSGMTI